MEFAVEVGAVEAAATRLRDAYAVTLGVSARRRLAGVESGLPGWQSAVAAGDAGYSWARTELGLALSLGAQADDLLAAAQGYRDVEAGTTAALEGGR